MSTSNTLRAEYKIIDPAAAVAFTELFHVTHVEPAKKVVTDAKISPRTISNGILENKYDVTWVSPNDWRKSIYGQVRFAVPANVLHDKPWRYYWVEEISHDSRTALRIFVSLSDLSASLHEFDPRTLGGPIFIDNNGLYYTLARERASTGHLNYEFMLHGGIPLPRVSRLDF